MVSIWGRKIKKFVSNISKTLQIHVPKCFAKYFTYLCIESWLFFFVPQVCWQVKLIHAVSGSLSLTHDPLRKLTSVGHRDCINTHAGLWRNRYISHNFKWMCFVDFSGVPASWSPKETVNKSILLVQFHLKYVPKLFVYLKDSHDLFIYFLFFYLLIFFFFYFLFRKTH